MKDVTNSQKIMLIVLGLAFLYLLYDDRVIMENN